MLICDDKINNDKHSQPDIKSSLLTIPKKLSALERNIFAKQFMSKFMTIKRHFELMSSINIEGDRYDSANSLHRHDRMKFVELLTRLVDETPKNVR